MSEEWVKIEEVNGDITAEIIRGMLEAQGIMVWLNQEGAGKAYGISIPTLGLVHVMVPTSQQDTAVKILNQYYQGNLESNPVPEESGEEFREDDLELAEEDPQTSEPEE